MYNEPVLWVSTPEVWIPLESRYMQVTVSSICMDARAVNGPGP